MDDAATPPPPDDAPPADGDHLSLETLASLAGLTPRTVRYYVQEGLVSPPEGAKRGAFYTRLHLEQLLQVRRRAGEGMSLERIRQLQQGAKEDPPPTPVRPGTVEVWSRVTLADGVEVHLEPGRAGLSPQQVRALVKRVTLAYREVRGQGGPGKSNDKA
jgi:DNA-binding transcriptional MerR regulator